MVVTLPSIGASGWGTTLNAAFDEILNTTRTAFEFPTWDKGGRVFDVRAFGAAVDGSTDDTAALSAALTAANSVNGIVTIPQGTMKLANGLTTALMSGVTLEGAGRSRTIITCGTNASGDLFYLSTTPTDFTIRGITFDGNKANQSADRNGLVIEVGSNFLIDDVEVKDAGGRGFYLYQCTNYTLNRPKARNIGRGSTRTTDSTHAAILLAGGTARANGKILHADIDTALDMGIVLAGDPQWDLQIVQPIIIGVHYIGIACGAGNHGILIDGAVVRDVTGNAIDTGSCWDVVVSNFAIEGCESGIIPDGSAGSAYNLIFGPGTMKDMISPDAEGDADYVSNGIALSFLGGPTTYRNMKAHNIVIDGCAGVGVAVLGPCIESDLENITVRNPGMASTRFPSVAAFAIFTTTGKPIKHVRMRGCRGYDDRGTALMPAVVSFNGPAADIIDNTIEGNDFRDSRATSAPITYTNGVTRETAGIVRDNLGGPDGVLTFTASDTTPSVKNGSKFRTNNGSSTTITNFDDGQEGDVIHVLLDANTILDHGATIKLAGGTDLTGTANDTVTLMLRSGVWYELARSVNG